MGLRPNAIFAVFLALAGCMAGPAPASSQRRGMVSAADPRAGEAGAEMLRQEGSAADAALATLLALTVVEPQSSGIGGGGFLLYEDGDGTPDSYDGRETAPAEAGPDWFLRHGRPISLDEASPGGMSVGVPGNLRLMAVAHRRHGKLPWAKLFEPAIRLARGGFAITPRLHRPLASHKKIAALSAQARSLYYDANGDPLPVGAIVRNPALARLLEQLAARGPDSFYVGPNAMAMVAAVNNAPVNPSPMRIGDLSTYDAKPRPPVCGTYRAYRICGMGPPSAGATSVLAILKQLERFDLAALGPNSSTSWHLMAESMRLAFADRDKYLADPDFVIVPVAGLIDPGYLSQRSALISPDRTIENVAAGNPAGGPVAACSAPTEEAGTSHFVAADRWGNVASLTSTIARGFGSGLMVNGYYLNNELTDFSFEPEPGGCALANRMEGSKRPRSSMSPTIVYGPDGKVRLAVGAAGGATIPAQVAKIIIGVLDWNVSAQQAIALPIIYAPGDMIFLERASQLEALEPQLRRVGHHQMTYREPSSSGKASAIEQVDGRWVGAADPRTEGVAISE